MLLSSAAVAAAVDAPLPTDAAALGSCGGCGVTHCSCARWRLPWRRLRRTGGGCAGGGGRGGGCRASREEGRRSISVKYG
eukprot:SAG31_NODE_5717_length_2365_cov_1.321271_1_plen_80_part_00